MIFPKLKMRLNIAILMVFAANYVQKQYALLVAEKKSLILLQHNLAIHSYLNNNLKPNLFALKPYNFDQLREGLRGVVESAKSANA